MAELNFDELKKQLELLTWPMIYMFKFIVPSDNQKIAFIEGLFDEASDVKLQPSSAGKYTSITARQVMLNAENVIEIYRRAASVEGIIAL
jgi:uncharacterized protein